MGKFIIRLKQLRTERNISMRQLAKEIGVSNKAISLWESGERIPNALAIINLAKFFGVTTDYLLGMED